MDKTQKHREWIVFVDKKVAKMFGTSGDAMEYVENEIMVKGTPVSRIAVLSGVWHPFSLQITLGDPADKAELPREKCLKPKARKKKQISEDKYILLREGELVKHTDEVWDPVKDIWRTVKGSNFPFHPSEGYPVRRILTEDVRKMMTFDEDAGEGCRILQGREEIRAGDEMCVASRPVGRAEVNL